MKGYFISIDTTVTLTAPLIVTGIVSVATGKYLLLDRYELPLHEIKHVCLFFFIGYVFYGYQSLRADVCAADSRCDSGRSINGSALLLAA